VIIGIESSAVSRRHIAWERQCLLTELVELLSNRWYWQLCFKRKVYNVFYIYISSNAKLVNAIFWIFKGEIILGRNLNI
jgi:hypothetical protein